MKRIATPKSWMLSKLGGTWATRPSQGPHKLRECMPLSIILQHKLKYAMNGRECKVILNDKDGNIKVNFYLYLIFYRKIHTTSRTFVYLLDQFLPLVHNYCLDPRNLFEVYLK